MPFPRTWVEELLAEWLEYQGYMVGTGLTVPIQHRQEGSKGGGRYEADVVGVRCSGDQCEIRHIESGAYVDQNIVDRLRKKFSSDVCEEIKKRYAWSSAVSGRRARYIKQYVVTHPHQKPAEWERWVTEISKVDSEVEVIALDNLLRDEILPGLRRSGSSGPTIPEGYWLLCSLAYAHDYEIMQGMEPVHRAERV